MDFFGISILIPSFFLEKNYFEKLTEANLSAVHLLNDRQRFHADALTAHQIAAALKAFFNGDRRSDNLRPRLAHQFYETD